MNTMNTSTDTDTSIHIYQRHCFLSLHSVSKNRPAWHDPLSALQRLLKDVSKSTYNIKYTALYDNARGDVSGHFLSSIPDIRIVQHTGGSDPSAYLNMLDTIKSDNLSPDDIVYILEDDYVHRGDWIQALVEGVTVGSYVTLYDHPDKYNISMYPSLKSQIVVTPSFHWRTTPSTTSTFACRVHTLLEHTPIHKRYCEVFRGCNNDHGRFVHLWNTGASLVSCIPGLSTHVEEGMISPCIPETEWMCK